ncbi:hypothetical protein LWI28_001217 [Acer negundo]|uniref:Uncharacterized protein n=1 Tax=Acer negundo TaxID=4023 RepID=A0AAD5IT70_ACENE|nr:hypothetical protein LWI28_001217 [Acer negundo]
MRRHVPNNFTAHSFMASRLTRSSSKCLPHLITDHQELCSFLNSCKSSFDFRFVIETHTTIIEHCYGTYIEY